MNLILQHWSGEPGELERASWASISAYADRLGAMHAVLRGTPMGKRAFPHLQKLAALTDVYDRFGTVVMMDSDMFVRAGTVKSIFDVPGIGVVGPLQRAIRSSLHQKLPDLFRRFARADYYGGALYKFDPDERRLFRAFLTRKILKIFDAYEYNCDEGAMHYLAAATGTKDRELPDGEMWACSSFDPNVGAAHLVHVRRRIEAGREERRDKLENYEALISAGVLTR